MATSAIEAEGLVSSAWVTDDGPPRRTYRLTDAGRVALDEWIAVMHERARLIDAFKKLSIMLYSFMESLKSSPFKGAKYKRPTQKSMREEMDEIMRELKLKKA